MIKRFGTGKLSKEKTFEETANPMDSLTNLADVMLVFACGIMLALIVNWNVDVGGTATKPVEVEQGQEVTQMENIDGSSGELDEDGQYEEMGTVYRDPQTGKLYMIEKDS